MTYKYANQLAALDLTSVQCPCHRAAPHSGLVYRLIWQPATDEINFVPRTLVPGVKRKIKTVTSELTEQQTIKAEDEACNDWAISLHTDPTASRLVCKKFKSLPYTHIAEIELAEEHGMCTPPDNHQHLNLHEAVGTDLASAIIQVQPL